MSLKLEKRGKVWYVTGRFAGHRYCTSTRQTQKAKAAAWLTQFQERLAREQASGHTDRTFAQAVNASLDRNPDWGDVRFIERILPHLGNTLLSKINNETIDELRKKLYPDASPATVKRQLLTPIKAVHNFAAKREWVTPLSWETIYVEEPDPVWLTPQQFEDLLKLCLPRYQRVLIFQYGTGLRISEVLGLKWGDLSPDMTHLHLPRKLTKMGYARTVWVQPRARTALGQRGAGSELVFPEFTSRQTLINYLARRHDRDGFPIRVTTHVARHSWATWTYAMSQNLHYVMMNGGWKDADTMLIYTHYATPDVAAQARALGWTWLHGDKTTSAPTQKP